jgi:hypothetical protein
MMDKIFQDYPLHKKTDTTKWDTYAAT